MAIHQPHDKFFKITFGIKEVIRAFLGRHLNKEDIKQLNLDTLEVQKNSFIDKKLKACYSDVIYRVNTLQGDGYLYFLLEHQSTSDPFMPARILQYTSAIMMYDMKKQLANGATSATLKIPVVRPFVIYSGKEKYDWPTEFTAEIGKGILFPKSFKDNCLIELRNRSTSDILKDGQAAVAEILLKECWQKDFCKILDENPKLGELIGNSPYMEPAIMYILDQDPHDVEIVLNKINSLNDNKKNEIMESGLQRMRQQSEQRGEQQGMRKVIEQFLASGMSKKEVASVVGFTLKRLENLLKLDVE